MDRSEEVSRTRVRVNQITTLSNDLALALAAPLAGIFIPLGLNRLKFDPAVSSTVFVTTVTDVVGFFAFLGLAALWLR